MTTGFTCVGDDGYVQVDENYRNYALIAKGSASTTTNFASASFTTISQSGLTNPVLAIVGTGSAGVTVTSSTSSTSGGVTSFSWVVYGAGASPVAFDYFIFDNVPPTPRTSGYGLIVKNAAGQVTFDSAYKYMRVAAFVTPGQTFSSQSGRRYAMIFSGGVIQIQRSGGTGNTQVATTTGYGTTGNFTIQVYTGAFPPATMAFTYSLLYVDVTGF